MEEEMKAEVAKWNRNDNELMEVWTLSREWFRLVLGGEELMDGDAGDLVARVKQLNREYGYSWL